MSGDSGPLCGHHHVRAALERVAIKLEGQVELTLSPVVHPCSTHTGDEYQFVLGALDYFGDDRSVALSSPLLSPGVFIPSC